MSIKELKEKIKGLWSRVVENEKDLYIILIVIIITLGAFGLGRLSVVIEQDTPVTFSMIDLDKVSSQVASVVVSTEQHSDVSEKTITKETGSTPQPEPKSVKPATSGRVVASKNGTKYHLPECSGAKRIKEENKIWFDSVEDAKAAGYTAAANCLGI